MPGIISSSELLPKVNDPPIWCIRQTKANTLTNWEIKIIWDHCGIWWLVLKNGCGILWLTAALLWPPNVNSISTIWSGQSCTLAHWDLIYPHRVGQLWNEYLVSCHPREMKINRAEVMFYMSYCGALLEFNKILLNKCVSFSYSMCIYVCVDMTYSAFK